jgi:hypothetical protein
MSIGSHKLVDASTTQNEPFTINEIKIAKNLADSLFVVYGKRHSLEGLIRDTRVSAEKARLKAQNVPNRALPPRKR